MDSGYYAACAGMRAQTQALEVVANNLANLSTAGYRGQLPMFRSLLAGASASGGANPLNRAINDFNVMGEARVDQSAGNLQPTGNPFDLAIEGNGFFVIQTKAGIRYTRNGGFQVSTKGQLTTAGGDSVLGDQGPLTVPSGSISISADGTLSVAGAVFGKLRIAEFSPDSALASEGNSYYSASGTAPHAATGSAIRQGMLESSNVNAVLATVNLISVQRRFGMLQDALSAYYNTFNRIAADDLPRV